MKHEYNAPHDHDDDGDCLAPHCWRFSLWDIAGLLIATLAHVLGMLSGGGLGLAREFFAMANWSRRNRDIKVMRRYEQAQRRAMSEDLRKFVDNEGDGTP